MYRKALCLSNRLIQRRSTNITGTYSIIGPTRYGSTLPPSYTIDKTPITVQLWNTRTQLSSDEDSTISTNSTPQILTKTVNDSLQNDANNNLLLGKILQDMDALAGNVAYLHCYNEQAKAVTSTLVTASVEKISFIQDIPITIPITMIGSVIWVGRSSLDICIEIVNKDNEDIKYMSSIFTYVARHKATKTAVQVNKLIVENIQLKSIFNERNELALARKQAIKAIPQHCSTRVLELLSAGNAVQDMPALGTGSVLLMGLTTLENSFICQPQNVNTAGRVFGGFLMHRAYDLAEATSYTFAGANPRLLEVDKISFKRPVDIGNLVRIKTKVVCSMPASSNIYSIPVVAVEVSCQIINPEKASSIVSNTFSFVFGFPNDVMLREVVPSSSEEAKQLIDAEMKLML